MDDLQVKYRNDKRVFVSSTTKDLGSCRKIVTEILNKFEILPIVEDFFEPDHRKIEAQLHEKIWSCDAVICIIGHYFGVIPKDSNYPGRSYTQIEYDISRELNKPIYVFIASDDYVYSTSLEESEDIRDLQLSYRKEVLSKDRGYVEFSTEDQLKEKIYQAIDRIKTIPNKQAITYIDPPPPPAYFVGRQEEIAQLREAIFLPEPAIIVIIGMGGQGKSTLLAQTIKSLKYSPFMAGIWISANRGGSSFSHLLDIALENFQENYSNKPKEPTWEGRLKELMDIMQKHTLLIVLDGAEIWLQGWAGIDSPDDETKYTSSSRAGIYEGFDKFLDDCSFLHNGSHLIVTSRAIPAVLDNVKLSILPVIPEKEKYTGLRGLDPADAVDLLKSMGVIASQNQLEEIASRYFYHPLAITEFASLAKKMGKKWEELLIPKGLDAIETLRNLLLEIRKHLPNSLISNQLIKLASISIDNPPFELLKWLWYFDEYSKNETEEWLLQQVIMLSEWNIFSWDPENFTICFHPLIKEHFSRLFNKEEFQLIHARTGAFYNSLGFKAHEISLEGAKNKILAVKHYLHAGKVNIAIEIMFGSENIKKFLFDWFVRCGHLWECSELILEIASYCNDELKVQCTIARASVLNDLDLLEMAKEDIDHAIYFYERTDINNNPINQQNLAKAYGTKGTLFLERNKDNEAIHLFTSAIQHMEKATEKGVTDRIEIAKSYTNRGLAKKGVGNFSAAKLDFNEAIEQIALINENTDELKKFKLEVLIQISRLNFKNENITEPLIELTKLVGELEKYQDKEIRKLDRNYLLSKLFLGNAWNTKLNPHKALEILNEIVIPLSILDSEGLRNIRGILALGLENRSQSYFLFGDYEKAMEDLMAAKSLYYDHIKGNRNQFKCQLSNALFNKAKINYILNNPEEGKLDLQEGASIAHDWIINWFDDYDIKDTYLINSIEALSYLPDSQIREKKLLLGGISLICDILIKVDRSIYLAQIVCSRIIRFKDFILNKAAKMNFNLPDSFFILVNSDELKL